MLKRPIALLLLFTTVPQLGGCAIHGTVGVRPSELTPEERNSPGDPRIVGVVYGGSQRLLVDSQPPTLLSHDTLHAWAGGGEHRIPRSLVQALLVRRYDRAPVSVGGSDPSKAADAVLGPHVLAVQRWQGAEVTFDRGRAVWYSSDTLYGVVRGAAYRIANDSIRSVSVVRTNVIATALVSVPLIFIGGILALSLIAQATCTKGSFMCGK